MQANLGVDSGQIWKFDVQGIPSLNLAFRTVACPQLTRKPTAWNAQLWTVQFSVKKETEATSSFPHKPDDCSDQLLW